MAKNNVADLIIHGGNIITMDETCPSAEALAIQGGRIVALGAKNQVALLEGPRTKYLELGNNQTLLPGLIEAHQHASQTVNCRCLYFSCSAYYYNSYAEIKALFETELAKIDPASGKWCTFLGWDPEMIDDLPGLDFAVLDAYSTDIPFVVIGQSGHTAWSNRKAFDVAGIPEGIADPEGGVYVRDPTTKALTGQMLEAPAIMPVLGCAPQPTIDEMATAIDAQWKEYASNGFTTVTDLAYMPNPEFDDLLQTKASSPDCPVRLCLYKLVYGPGETKLTRKGQCGIHPVEKGKCGKKSAKKIEENQEKLWYAGIKVVADGSPHCGTAAVRQDYLDNDLTKILGFPPPPNSGTLNYTAEALLETVKYWHEQGKQVAIHTHGERAIEQVLDIYEQVLSNSPVVDHRFRMEHLGLADEDHIQRAAKLNLGMSFFVSHLYFYAKSYTQSVFGPERTKRWTPLSLATKHGLRWTLHQDHPTFPGIPQPLSSMKTAVTRTHRDDPKTVYGAEYVVSAKEALKAYTIDAAWQIHKDKELGSLTVGKRADLVILSDNPLTVDPFKLEEIKVVDTYLDGRSNNIQAWE